MWWACLLFTSLANVPSMFAQASASLPMALQRAWFRRWSPAPWSCQRAWTNRGSHRAISGMLRQQGPRARQCRRGLGKKRFLSSSSVDKVYYSKEVHLADVDTAVAQHRVRHRNVEVDVRNRHLKEIIFRIDHLPTRPGEADFAVFCAFVLCLAHAFSEINGFPDACAQLLDGLLIIFVFRGRLPREPGGRCLHVIASALHLVDQRLHVGR